MLVEAKAAGLLEHTGALVLSSAPSHVVGWRAVSKMKGLDVLVTHIEAVRVA